MTQSNQSQSTAAAIKFRPSLSAAQLELVISALSVYAPPGDKIVEYNNCMKLLRVFALKAQHGIVSPSHVATGTRPDLANSLGFGEPVAAVISSESLFKIWQVTPNVLSPTQLAAVGLYRYQNDMMAPEEEQAYEHELSDKG